MPGRMLANLQKMTPQGTTAGDLIQYDQLLNTNVNGLTCNIYAEPNDPTRDAKLSALTRAVELVRTKGAAGTRNALDRMNPLDVVVGQKVMCEALWDPEGAAGTRYLFLGDKWMFTKNDILAGKGTEAAGKLGARGVANQVYDDQRRMKISPQRWYMMWKGTYQASKVSAMAGAAVVHEFGHLIHERLDGDRFWYNKTHVADTPALISAKVSNYSANQRNLNEFVAEVFAGLIHGKRYPADVMNLYNAQGGPPVL